MRKWEYLTISLPLGFSMDVINFDEIGEQGWELVSVSNGTAYFRREKEYEIEVKLGPSEHKEAPNV